MDRSSQLQAILPCLEGVFYIATVEGDQPRVRPFDAAAIVDEKIFIGTKSNKKVYAEILENPKVEIFSMGKTGMLRIAAEAYPVEDKSLNDKAYDKMGKDSEEEFAAAIELRHVKGFLKDSTGKEIEINF